MRALIFAAGVGERMRPLTATTPKPLLHVGDAPLIVWHLRRLAAIGVREVVVNTSWLAACFAPALGDGSMFGLRLHLVYEGETPLETGGGMLHALPLLGDAPFIAVSGDIWTDFDFTRLHLAPGDDAHLVLVDNPPHHPGGDFVLDTGRVRDARGRDASLTFAGIGLYHPRLLDGWRSALGDDPGVRAQPPRFKLAPLLRAAMETGRVGGQHHAGAWTDVGTPERLAQLDAALR